MENTDRKDPVDRYFREGLKDHRAVVRPEFWDRFEGKFERKRHLGWAKTIQIAAGILLLIGLGSRWAGLWQAPEQELAAPSAGTQNPMDASEKTPALEISPRNEAAGIPEPGADWAKTPVLSSAPPAGLRPKARQRPIRMAELRDNAARHAQKSILPEPTVDLAPQELALLSEPDVRLRWVLPQAESLIDPLIDADRPNLPYDERLKAYAAQSVGQLIRGEPLSELPKPNLPIDEFKKPVEDLFALGEDLGKWFNEPRTKPGQPQNKP